MMNKIFQSIENIKRQSEIIEYVEDNACGISDYAVTICFKKNKRTLRHIEGVKYYLEQRLDVNIHLLYDQIGDCLAEDDLDVCVDFYINLTNHNRFEVLEYYDLKDNSSHYGIEAKIKDNIDPILIESKEDADWICEILNNNLVNLDVIDRFDDLKILKR